MMSEDGIHNLLGLILKRIGRGIEAMHREKEHVVTEKQYRLHM